MFGISNKDLLDKTKIKVINGIAGSGKSTETVNTLRSLNVNFCLASFSNALKFAAYDKFNCPVDTICGLAFINSPFPRSDERDVTEYETVILDEILLDGVECIKWIKNHAGKNNIIALTDSRQMLNADNGRVTLKAFNELIKQRDVVYVDIDKTRRARDDKTRALYEKLYNMDSNLLLTVNEVKELYGCDVVNIEDIMYDKNNTYLCHSNIIEHEIYKMYNLPERSDIDIIPKNHISRNRNVDRSKYPVCDQLTADKKRINAYLQAANVATPTRYQGKEVDVKNECYFVVKTTDIFKGREVYTVLTRCQSVNSLHIAIMDIKEYKDPETINGRRTGKVERLNIPGTDKKYTYLSPGKMVKLIDKYGEPDINYSTDFVTDGENIIYSTMSNNMLNKIATIDGDEIRLNKKYRNTKKSIKSVTKKDVTMHFDFMNEVFNMLKTDIIPARIINGNKSKKEFSKLCDIYAAFPTILKNCEMPSAGYLYTEYDKDLLNYYRYHGDKVTKGALITENLAKKLGDSTYVFSTNKQIGCELGRYTYEQSRKSKENKKNINNDFLWGRLESGYYTICDTVRNGQVEKIYVKHSDNNLQLVACALWSELCLIMINIIEQLNLNDYVVITDGIYYNSDKIPQLPEWCDFRIEDLTKPDDGSDEKYKNVIYKTYADLQTKAELKKDREKKRRASMTDEQKAKRAAYERERRAKKKALSQ